MPLSPDDIERRQFLPALRGYDRDQVDAFLTEVAEDYRSLLRKFELFQKQQQAAPPEASDQLSGLGERVERVLRIAVQSAIEIKAAAEEEVARLREEANRELQAAQEALAKAAHESGTLATEAAALNKRRREVQRMLEEAAEVRSGADREAADLRATAQREASQLREAGERDAAELQAAAMRDAADLREAAERDAADLWATAEREAAELQAAAEWACQESANVLEAAEEERRKALNLPTKQNQEDAGPIRKAGSAGQPAPGPGTDRGDSSHPTATRPWFPFVGD